MLGDINSNGLIQSNDTTIIQRVIGLVAAPLIPSLPTGISPPPVGPDPKLFIPNVSATTGSLVAVPVDISVSEPNGITVSSFSVVIQFDPNLFTYNSATIGSLFAVLGAPQVSMVTGQPGVIVIQAGTLNGTGTIANGTSSELFTLMLNVASNVPNGTTSVINLRHDATYLNQTTTTSIYANDANLTELTLTPAPSNNSTDPVDGTVTVGPTTTTLTSISVTPANPTLAKGQTQQFVATGLYSDGTTADLSNQVTWTSTTPTVASITVTGLATALTASGTSTITATFGTVSGSTVLNASVATLKAITLSPATPTIAKGATLQFTATGTFSDGTTADLTSQVTWASASPAVATINPSTGLATAVAQGTATISAAFGVFNTSTVLTISTAALTGITVSPGNPSVAKGRSQQFTATGAYSDGTTADLTSQVTWASASPAVATISNAVGSQGLALGVGVGSTGITATLGSLTGTSATLNVTAAVLTSIGLSPLNPSIAKGATLAFKATGTYSDGTTADLTSQVAWASANSAIATIGAATGIAQGVGTGTTGISATLGGVASPSNILTVTPAPLTTIAISPVNPSAKQGATLQFIATGTYSDGTTADLTSQVTWASASPAVATISNAAGSAGLASAFASGTSNITASLGGVTSPPDSLTVPTIRANLLGTLNLMDLCVAKSSRRFVLMSSAEVYGAQPDGTDLIGEQSYGGIDILNPRACYSEGKRAAETICAVYQAQHGIRAHITRFGHVYGPGMALDDGRVQADFAANVVAGRDIVLNSDGSAVRTYTYVADAVAGLFYALLLGTETAYNVADPGGLVSIRRLATLFTEVRPERGLRLVFTDEADARAYSSVKGQGLSSERLAGLGWAPVVGLPAGLDRMVTDLETRQRDPQSR